MDEFIVGGSVFLTLAIGLFILFVAVLWVLLPFAVFGIKRRLDKIIVENERSNSLLRSMARQGSNSATSG